MRVIWLFARAESSHCTRTRTHTYTLHDCAGHDGCLAHLLSIKGIDVNARVCGGDTPLYLALEGRQAAREAGTEDEGPGRCVQLLIDAGGISFSGKQLALV